MGKKHSRSLDNLPRRLVNKLGPAVELIEQGDAAEAVPTLEELEARYPKQPIVLEALSAAYYEVGDMRSYLRTLRKLSRATPNRPDIVLALADAYMVNDFLALALFGFRKFLKRWPQHEEVEKVNKIIVELEEALREMMPEGDLEFEENLDFVRLHEEAQVCLNLGELQRAKSILRKLQRQKPDFPPLLNNLSQIYWMEGDMERALESTQEVLDIEPDNIHALGNRIRFLYLAGRQAEAAPLVERLKASQATASDRWKKIAETLAFIGDDEGLLELAARAEREADPDELDEMFYHLVAVSECMLGNEKAARAHWKRALKINAVFQPAYENLADLKKPAHERNGPWAFPLSQMLPPKAIRELKHVMQRSDTEEKLQDALRRLLDAHPGILSMVPLLLERGEPLAKELVMEIAEWSAQPALLAALKEYALGQRGSDGSRLRAAHTLVRCNAIPSGNVTLWLEGEWSETLLLGFQITPEPLEDQYPLTPKALPLMEKAIEALHTGNGVKAETLLRQALTIQPDHPGLLNNLAMALSMQRKMKEYHAILERLFNDFPDYFFGQMALARQAIQNGELEQAEEILDHWTTTKKLYHVSEFNMLCQTQIEYLLAEGSVDGARSWLDIWKSAGSETPAIRHYEKRIKRASRMRKFPTMKRRKKGRG